MANLNKVFLMGNLTRDPELKYTQGGAAVGKMSVAVNRQYKGQDGEMKKEVQFFNVVVWGKTAENCSNFLAKGRPIFVEGRLQNQSWEKDGQKHQRTEIVADVVQFLGAAGGQGGAREGQGGGEPQPPAGESSQPEFDQDGNVPFCRRNPWPSRTHDKPPPDRSSKPSWPSNPGPVTCLTVTSAKSSHCLNAGLFLPG